MSFWTGERVLVTGGAGFLGSHVVHALGERECRKVIVARRRDYDLTNEGDVKALFENSKPTVVFHLAGLVGGILPNKERPAEFFYTNMMIGTLVLHYAWKHGVKKFVAAGAGCGYPEHSTMPLKEESFWEGFPQKESAPYSLAKRLLHVQSIAYRQQYSFDSVICIPGNIYGPFDNFNLLDAHVIPALVRKFVEAAQFKLPSIDVWGSGRPTRDFVYAADVAQGMLRAAEVYDRSEIVNMSSGVETSIGTVCDHLRDITGFNGEVIWNSSRPDGQLRRCFDVTKARTELGFTSMTDIRSGLEKTARWYSENMNKPELRK